MTRLTEDLLLLAHTDESRFIQREAIDLRRFLAELVASAEPTTDRRLRVSAQIRGSSTPTAIAWRRRCATCCATPPSTPRPAARSSSAPANAPTGACRSGSTTTARGSLRPSATACSTASIAPTPRAPGTAGGTGLAWRSSVRSSTPRRPGLAADSPLGGARVVIELPGYRSARLPLDADEVDPE